ncbi:MAG: pyruvate kinase, partial [Nitrospiria bacterium]
LDRESVILKAGDPFILTSRPMVGDWRGVSVSFSGLSAAVKPGETILLHDGAIELVVETVDGDAVTTRVTIGGILGSHKGVNIPGRSLAIAALTPKDREDAAFAVKHDLEWLALSFVRHADDVRSARAYVKACGREIPIIAKIEKREAVAALDDIVREADGLMVARGDLGVEIDLAEVPFVQKTIIERALAREAPVITATQMLESMIDSPRPTRAEATDVATAVLDGTDAVMLSEETALGRYPVEAVRTMARLVEHAEMHIDRSRFMSLTRAAPDPAAAVAKAVCTLAAEVGATAILVPTSGGTAPVQIATRRPTQPIIALTEDRRVLNRLALAWGVVTLPLSGSEGAIDMSGACVEAALNAGLISRGDLVIVTRGTRSEGRNLIELTRV